MLRKELTYMYSWNNLHYLWLTSIIWLKQVGVHRIFYHVKINTYSISLCFQFSDDNIKS